MFELERALKGSSCISRVSRGEVGTVRLLLLARTPITESVRSIYSSNLKGPDGLNHVTGHHHSIDNRQPRHIMYAKSLRENEIT
jgi:hypothetical protein